MEILKENNNFKSKKILATGGFICALCLALNLFFYQNYQNKYFLISNNNKIMVNLPTKNNLNPAPFRNESTLLSSSPLAIQTSGLSTLVNSETNLSLMSLKTTTTFPTTTLETSTISVKNEKISLEKRIDAFNENQKSIVTNLKPKRFVYFGSNGAGYGNKMYSLISAFTLALYTNSALIISWKDIDKYIEEPFYKCFISNSSIDNELSYLYRKNETENMPYMTSLSFKTNKLLKNFWRFRPNENKTRYVFAGIGPVFFDFACDLRFFETFIAYDLVSQETINKALPFLEKQTEITTNATSLDVVYKVGFELGYNILNKFWRPNLMLRSLVEYYIKKYFSDYYVIGMQLRYEYLKWEDTNAFFECTKEIEKRIENKTVKWYLSSDNGENLKKISDLYPNKAFHAEESLKITHVDRDSNGYLRALLDIELLSRTNELIITGGSTFGFMAVLRNGKNFPLFVNGKRNETTCTRLSFSETSLTPFNDAIFRK